MGISIWIALFNFAQDQMEACSAVTNEGQEKRLASVWAVSQRFRNEKRKERREERKRKRQLQRTRGLHIFFSLTDAFGSLRESDACRCFVDDVIDGSIGGGVVLMMKLRCLSDAS